MAAAAKKKDESALHIFKGTKMEQLKELYGEWYGCTRCPLHEARVDGSGEPFQDITFGDGNPDSKILIVGEAPGAEEEVCGVPFVGQSGRLLNTILAATSSNPDVRSLWNWFNSVRHTKEVETTFHDQILEWRRKEFFITNVVACRPPDNRQPNHSEVQTCWERLYNTIYIVDPWFILAFGKSAMEALVHKKVEVTKMRGKIFEMQMQGRLVQYSIPIMCCLHPSYLLRVADYKNRTGPYMKTVHDVFTALKFVDGLWQKLAGVEKPARPELP